MNPLPMSAAPLIFLHYTLNDAQAGRLREALPGLVFCTRAEIQATPELLARVEIVYGQLRDDEWTQARALRWVQTPWVGVEKILTPAFRAAGVPLYKSAGVNARCMVESMFGMLLVHTRRLQELWRGQERRAWVMDDVEPRQDSLEGKTLGLLGVGQIGGLLATVGAALAMRIVGCRRGGAPHPLVGRMFGPESHERREFLSQCDVVFNTLPLTPETCGFVGPQEFAAMKPEAVLAVFGRSGTVDTAAMIEALRAGRLGAALLNVYDTEPLPPADPLWDTPNVYISPHCSGHYHGRWDRSAEMFVENVLRDRRGEPLLNPVDREKGY